MEKEKVLIVDDEPDIVQQLKRIIAKEGFTVVTAADGREGLDVFLRELPGLVITDIDMPEINGIDLLRRIKKLAPQTEVIVVTGHGDYDIAIQVLRQEALDYLKKPVDLERLLVALGRYLEKSGAMEKDYARPTVLLLDDDVDAVSIMGRYLKKEGYEVFTGKDGEEGMRILSEQRIDVIVTDMMMPKKDGLELLCEVKKMPGDTEVILITGFGNEEVVVQAMRDGANNFLRKPVDIEFLLITVEKAYEKVNLKRALARKSRDLELTQNIMAKLTQHGDVVVDLRGVEKMQRFDIGKKLFDLAVLPIVTVDADMNCLYGNKYFSDIFSGDFSNIREFWPERLSKIGVHDFTYDVFKEKVGSLFASTENSVEVVKLSPYAYIVFSKLTVLLEDGDLHLVAVIFRGERK